jgi:hypothetical protein
MMTELETFLKQRTKVWASQITRLAKSFAPNHLKHAISSKTTDISGGTFRITTEVKNDNPTGRGHPNYGTSDAHAQEFGSGLRAKRGAKVKYPITPKDSPFLEFQGTNQYEGWLIRTSLVMHPGIQATNAGKGYIAPAQQAVRKQIKEELKTMGASAIRSELRKSFEGRK